MVLMFPYQKIGRFLYWLTVCALVFFIIYMLIDIRLYVRQRIGAPEDQRIYTLVGEQKARYLALRKKHGDVVVEGWPTKPVYYRNGRRCSFN